MKNRLIRWLLKLLGAPLPDEAELYVVISHTRAQKTMAVTQYSVHRARAICRQERQTHGHAELFLYRAYKKLEA